jgi:isoquinoline 1-oxidoreductase subunit alpha
VDAGAAYPTIEGLDPNGKHPLQTAWLELQVPQCGYCRPGQEIIVFLRYEKP